jgi:hypothetical protein
LEFDCPSYCNYFLSLFIPSHLITNRACRFYKRLKSYPHLVHSAGNIVFQFLTLYATSKDRSLVKSMSLLNCVDSEGAGIFPNSYKIVNLTITSKQNLCNLKLLYLAYIMLLFSMGRRLISLISLPSSFQNSKAPPGSG